MRVPDGYLSYTPFPGSIVPDDRAPGRTTASLHSYSFLYIPWYRAASISAPIINPRPNGNSTFRENPILSGPFVRFPATCAECAKESLVEYPVALVAHSLLTGRGIRLYAECHDKYWTATFLEREQLREYLATTNAESLQCTNPAEHPSAFEAASTSHHEHGG